MKNPKPKDFVELITITVNSMSLPRWYSRGEGYSIGFVEVAKTLSKYRKSMTCSLRTYVANRVRWAVKTEIRKLARRHARTVYLTECMWASFPDWRDHGEAKEENAQEGPKEDKEEDRST